MYEIQNQTDNRIFYNYSNSDCFICCYDYSSGALSDWCNRQDLWHNRNNSGESLQSDAGVVKGDGEAVPGA